MTNEAKTSNSTDPMYWFNLAVENFIVQGKSKRTAETYLRQGNQDPGKTLRQTIKPTYRG